MDKKAVIFVAAAAAVIAGSTALMFQTFETTVGTPPDSGLGLVVNTPTRTPDIAALRQTYQTAADSGIGRSNVYMFWNIVEPGKGEFDWRQPDVLMSLNNAHGLNVTLYFSVINGGTLGPFPAWMGRPQLDSIDAGQLSATLDAILSRYHIIDSVIIAGQADEHFRYNEHEIPAYRDLFDEVYAELKPRHPGVSFGNAYSLHGVINKNLGHIPEQLDTGDFVAFTYFPTDSLNEVSKTPDEAVADLGTALEIAGERPAAFLEVSWPTSAFVGGSEQDQAEFVSGALEFYGQNRESIQFMTWYRQHDGQGGSCVIEQDDRQKEAVISGLGGSEHVLERLAEYVCSAGLIRSDGTPKPGWGALAAGT